MEWVSTIDEAVAHCGAALGLGEDRGGASADDASRNGKPDQDPQKPQEPQESEAVKGLPKSETIAMDEHGCPTIFREVDPETGEARTIVRNDDGSQRIFDESAVKSMTSSSEDELSRIIEEMTSHQLRGLVHEVGQRLLERSQFYHSNLSELERCSELLNYEYFSLSPEAVEKDLDNAYRKLARKMHPDKNGGTEHAKTRFQEMKERYETLKKKYSEDGGNGSKDKGDDEDTKADEDCEDGKDGKDGKDKSSIEYDPGDKDCMVKTVSKMATQLKNIEIQMVVLLKELGRAKSQVEKTSPS
ncbi:unnamed protein product [Polarella glacialis]|uniref:J domain-containing protein n=1 Tax=Polarella glacialis TaxID=89957 RepID=A0A813GC27_POLGL|nr:unnamed protein product [Polarella glacialis]